MDLRELECDVLVAGGGAAGVPCALAAARCGARVVLCQERSVLGGNASSEVRMHMVGADASGSRGAPLATEAREGGLIEEIRLEACVRNPQRSASMLDLLLYDKCRNQPGLRLLLDTAVTGVTMVGDRIGAALAERHRTEERFRIVAAVFVDCTGDGRLGAEAGAPYRHGREGQADYGESRALPSGDGRTLGSSLLFMARRHPQPMPFVAPPWARRFTESDLHLRPHAVAGVDRGPEYGYWWVEWGGQLDTLKDDERIRDELLAVALGVWDHIKNGHVYGNDDHGADSWALEWLGFLPGKRESRRFIGQQVLTEGDVMASRPAPDAIAYGGWPVDTHPPEGIDAPDLPPCRQDAVPHLYDIPLRCCVSAAVPNLMFAGRNLSATHVAFASTRVMATCAAVGQGVGTAAAYAAAHRLLPADLAADGPAIRTIRQRLLRDDAYLVGAVNAEATDVARCASATASSALAGAPAVAVLSGQTRAVDGPAGAPSGRSVAGPNRWISDPAAGLPAWLELAWERPVRLGQVRLVFDTGLHRPLTLTHSDAFAAQMVWGRPQPETAADYRLEARVDGTWRTVVEVAGNYQRLRVHGPADPPRADRLRLTVARTGGTPEARVCEVRVYEEMPGW